MWSVYLIEKRFIVKTSNSKVAKKNMSVKVNGVKNVLGIK